MADQDAWTSAFKHSSPGPRLLAMLRQARGIFSQALGAWQHPFDLVNELL